MDKLHARTPCAGLLPLQIGAVEVAEIDMGILTSIAPYAGQANASAEALEAAHGLAWPAAGRATGADGARVIWFGRDMVLLAGPVCDPQLGRTAAISDQSDAWASVSVSGAAAEEVLARLVPVDLRASQFRRGHAARTLIGHMNGAVTRLGADRFLLMVFRAMSRTLVHDLKRAMEAVAARG